jgi:hypothetical protein
VMRRSTQRATRSNSSQRTELRSAAIHGASRPDG